VFSGFAPPPASQLKAKMSQFSPYASLIYKTNRGFNMEIGGRWNKHSVYGSNFTYSLNPSYTIRNRIKIFANLYSAFKTPTLYQLFDPSAGNTGLKPEKGIIGEMGTEIIAAGSFRIRVVGFYRNTKNAILYIITDPTYYTSQYQNVSRQENYGAELETNYTAAKLTITANYTYTDGKTRSRYGGTGLPLGKDTIYYNLYRIPKHAVNLELGVQATADLFLSTQLHAVSEREEYIYGALPVTLKGYTTINLYGEYKFNKKLKAFTDLKNITNKQYFDILGYNSRRFNFTVGITLNL
jgi:vitamin B12 transporter